LKKNSERNNTSKAVSAGGVVYRLTNGIIEIIICGLGLPASKWGLPKGTPNPAETMIETAIRETQEETGLDVSVEQPLGRINYQFRGYPGCTLYNKTVYFYLMIPTGGSISDHDHEFDEVKWVKIETALTKITHENEARIIRRALKLIKEGYTKS
jgi:8-oxo-dGTP pyrophosphatase MutT (NUDIX family)